MPYGYEGYGMDEMDKNVIEGFMRTRRLLDEALVYADTATRLGDVAAVDPELAYMTRAQLVAFVSPVLAHRELVTTTPRHVIGDVSVLFPSARFWRPKQAFHAWTRLFSAHFGGRQRFLHFWAICFPGHFCDEF
jgi:hypothetical protein